MKLDMEPRSQTHPSGSTGIPENEPGGKNLSQHGPLPDLWVSHYHGLPAPFLEPKELKTGFSTGTYFQSLGLEGNGHLRALISALPSWREGYVSCQVGPSSGNHTTESLTFCHKSAFSDKFPVNMTLLCSHSEQRPPQKGILASVRFCQESIISQT